MRQSKGTCDSFDREREHVLLTFVEVAKVDLIAITPGKEYMYSTIELRVLALSF
jgi:hypothetical protein